MRQIVNTINQLKNQNKKLSNQISLLKDESKCVNEYFNLLEDYELLKNKYDNLKDFYNNQACEIKKLKAQNQEQEEKRNYYNPNLSNYEKIQYGHIYAEDKKWIFFVNCNNEYYVIKNSNAYYSKQGWACEAIICDEEFAKICRLFYTEYE